MSPIGQLTGVGPANSGTVLVRDAEPSRGTAQFQPFIGLLLLLGRNQRLACVATLPDSRLGYELGPTSAALLRHGLFQRKNPGLFRQ
jgi:hypothetical protein